MDEPADADQVASYREELAELFEYQGDDRVIDSHEALEIFRKQRKSRVLFSSGLAGLDGLIGGFTPGELIIVSGPTKHGKTSFCQTLTRNLSSRGIESLWFTFEVPPGDFLEKFPNLPHFKLPLALKRGSLKWLRKRIIESKAKYPNEIRIVFIDHLHFLVNLGQLRNPSLELGDIVRSIKSMAIEFDLVIFLICHLTKVKIDVEPTENDLRDSSFIAQDADSTLMIWRKLKGDATDRRSSLMVRNHRRTGTMGKGIDLIMVNGMLEEEDPFNVISDAY